MESFIQTYDIDFKQFQEVIINTESLVTGSAALALYFKQEGVEYNFVPSDIDIYVKGHDNKDAMVTFLQSTGYIRGPKFNDLDDITLPVSDYGNMAGIACILSYINRNTGKEIQLIVIENETDIHGFIKYQFDLSCCVTWWNAEMNQFFTIDKEHTLKKKLYFNIIYLEMKYEDQCLDERVLARFHKYIERGFTYVKAPLYPMTLNETDTKTDIYMCKPNKLTGTTAFDTWAYEDVDCCTFIAESAWNIVLCLGDQYFAFHRNNLFKYMKEHSIRVEHIGVVYTTPYKQTFLDEGMYMLCYEDYTVYELVPEYTTMSREYNPVQVSMYTVKCYTVAQWTSGVPGLIITPPAPPAEPAAPLQQNVDYISDLIFAVNLSDDEDEYDVREVEANNRDQEYYERQEAEDEHYARRRGRDGEYD
jgi:hypothetical protein